MLCPSSHVLTPILQEESSNAGHPHLPTQSDVVPIYPYPQLPASLADLPDLQLRNTLLVCPIGGHRAICRTADVIFVNFCGGGEHPRDVIFWKFPTCGIGSDDVA